MEKASRAEGYILIHDYFGIDVVIIWDIVRNKVPEIKRNILELYAKIETK